MRTHLCMFSMRTLKMVQSLLLFTSNINKTIKQSHNVENAVIIIEYI